jgi:hypothetical protein
MGTRNFVIAMVILIGFAFMNGNCDRARKESSAVRVVHDQGLEIQLDLSTQVLGLDIEEDVDYGDEEGRVESPVYATIASIPRKSTDFASASILFAKAKQFDDGLYAAVEYLCQDGTDHFVGKRRMLGLIADALKNLEGEADRESLLYCRGYIHAAAALGGQTIKTTEEEKIKAAKITSAFLSNQLISKPISFYTWTADLSKIFRQDRLLQQKLDSEKNIRLLARGVSKNEATVKAYRAYLLFVKKMTNPFPPEYCDLSRVEKIDMGKKYSFFPPSRSVETELIKKLYKDKKIPDGFSLIDTLVEKIRRREIDLKPGEDSGWYDYQVYALEPLVIPDRTPEAKKLDFCDTYKKELIALFKASLALTRETHIKQLEIPLAGSALEKPTVDIYPGITVEPVATCYLRRAQSYVFIRALLESTFGEAVLKKVHRLTATGTVSKNLHEELLEMEALFYGAYQVVAEEIGMNSDAHLKARSKDLRDRDKKFARKWIRTFADDPDVGADNRMMVPVFYDINRKKIKVWVVLGYSKKPLSISFKERPTVTKIIDAKGNRIEADLKFKSTTRSLIYPVSSEIYMKKLLNRSEFRALCDKYRTQPDIIKALGDL